MIKIRMATVSKARRLISIMRQNLSQHGQKLITILMMLVSLCGCSLAFDTPAPVTPAIMIPTSETPETALTEEPAAAETATPEGLYQPMSLPDGLRDELPVMQGICYEAARDAAGQTFVMRNAIDHIRFYEQADQSTLCRRAVTRYPFDFDSGRVLAGFWQVGRGCSAHHEVQTDRDETKKVITITTTFIQEGNCAYELVRPFWISIPDAAGWEITFVDGS